MRLFFVGGNDGFAELVGEIAKEVGGIEVRTLTGAPTGHEFVAAAVGLARTFKPDLVIFLSWKDHGEAVLEGIRDLCERIWVTTTYSVRGDVHREAAEADFILPQEFATWAVLRILFQDAKQRWEARQPMAVG